MARKKSLIRLPFLKVKINKYTINNIFGLLIFFGAFLSLLSFLPLGVSENQGYWLFVIKKNFENIFGSLAILFLLLLMIFSTYFFKNKKFHLIKGNIFVGLISFFIGGSVMLKSGVFGVKLADFLIERISFIGLYIFAIFSFLVSIILIFETSIEDVFLKMSKTLSLLYDFFKKAIVSEKKEKKEIFIESKIEKKPPLFIEQPKQEINETKKEEIPLIRPIISQNKVTSGKNIWVYPPLNLLSDISQSEADRGDLKQNAGSIESTLESFGIRAKVDEVNLGPAVTQYAIKITQGTKLSKITSLANDLALALAAPTGQVRIEAPIPGRSLVGIEIPNIRPEIVTLKRLLSSSLFIENSDPLLVPLGLDVSGNPQAYSISKMPHVLIAGATGSGKSVLLNAWITTFLFRTRPDQLRLILVDPKRVELTLYNGIPHLLTAVIHEKESIISALKWVVKEMESRLKEFARVGARNIDVYNEKVEVEKKPYIIFIIDELADIMMFAPSDVEDLITRIAQMARATGIHLILATQRPSVDVITGLMKANIPTRIAFNVSSMVDSRVIIDMPGAEKLLGKGDMLFLPPDQAKPKRIQGPFVTEKEVNNVVNFLKAQNPQIQYTDEVTEQEMVFTKTRGGTMVVSDLEEQDPLFNEAVKIIIQFDKASASLLQRRLSIGYARAARILDQLEKAGYVGPAEGSKPRDVIKRQIVSENEQTGEQS